MPGGKKLLDLKDALEDSPQTQVTLTSMESSTGPLRDFVLQMKDTCATLHSQQLKVAETVNHFGKLLHSVDDKIFGDKDQFALGSLRQLGKYVTELHSWQEMLCIQIDNAIVQQLDSFLTNDMSRLHSLKEAFHYSKTDHEQAIAKYNKVSKKKETERSRFDANSELFSVRRRFHQSSVQYYAELNSFQFKKKFQLLDPMLAFMHSQLAFFKMGHEILTDEVGKFLTMLNVEIQKVRSEYDQSMKQQKALAMELEQQSAQICIPDPDPSDPFVEYQPANLQLQSKSGYLLYRQQGSKWERAYFYTKEHLLYWQHVNRAAEVLIDLTAEGVDASSTDIDDRRYVFQIITIAPPQTPQQPPVRKALYFQAESAKSRDEWIATIVNIVAKRAAENQFQHTTLNLMEFESRERTDSDLVRMERERVRSFVQSHSTSKLMTAAHPTLPHQPVPTARQQVVPPLPPRRPPPPSHKSRPPPPPPVFGGDSSKQNSVQKLLEMADNESFETGSGYMNSFIIRYLGSLEIEKDKGVSVVKDAIRRIVAARALKNIMAIYYVKMVVTHKGISLVDPKSGGVTQSFKMKDVSYCACHPDNAKLFGFIARIWDNGKYKYICHVFESEKSSKEVYHAVIDAIKAAVNIVTTTSNRNPASSLPSSMTIPVIPHQEGQFIGQQQYKTMPTSPTVMPPQAPSLSLQPNITNNEDFNKSHVERVGSMPKSLSTGSFHTGQLASRLSLPTSRSEGEYYPDDEEEEDQYVQVEGINQSQDLLIDTTVQYEVSLQQQPVVEEEESSITETTTQHIYATVVKTPPPLPSPSPTPPLIDMEDTSSLPITTTSNTQHDTISVSPPVAATTTAVHQLDADFDSLLQLQQATDAVTGLVQATNDHDNI